MPLDQGRGKRGGLSCCLTALIKPSACLDIICLAAAIGRLASAFVVERSSQRLADITKDPRRLVPPQQRITSSSCRQNWPSSSRLYSATAASTETEINYRLLQRIVSGQVPPSSLNGEADRTLCLGLQLEKNGQARKASAALHEAATLYQCFLDKPSDFLHVTCLPSIGDVTAVLAYASMRLAFLNYDALGDPQAAVRLYREAVAIDPLPSAVSYDGIGMSVEASSTLTTTTANGENAIVSKLEEAVEAYRRGLSLAPRNRVVMFHLAVALERLGEEDEASDLLEQLRRDEAAYACLVDSWGYVRWHTRNFGTNLNLYRGTRDMLQVALQAAMPLIELPGSLVAEFGVGSGRSLRMTQELLPLDVEIHGFDTFTGLPQAWGNEPAGTYSTGGIVPNMEGKVYFHKGLFDETIGPFLDQAGTDAFLAYANIDCDLYSSTLHVFEAFHGRVSVGTVLVFDEYMGHETWRQDEFRAWRECCKRFGWKYEYLAFSLSTKQAVVRVISV